MNITLHKPIFANRVTAPTSKSAAHRALIAAAFADGKTAIRVTGAGEDIAATIRCLSGLGARIEERPGEEGCSWLEVFPVSRPTQNAVLDCGESGSTLRFMVPVVAALGIKATFLRRGRLPERPMEPLMNEMAAHGVRFSENSDGSLTVEGRLPAGQYTIAANVSSQFITGLLLALSLIGKPSSLTLTGEIESAPYIDMTVKALAAFGSTPERTADGRHYHIQGCDKCPLRSPHILYPEGDFSGAAFPLAAGALGLHPVTVTGLSFDSLQGDKEILTLLQRFGARIDISTEHGSATAFPSSLQGIEIDARQIPDLVPILAVIASFATGKTVIRGAARLRLKESDRIATTAAMLRALGGNVCEMPDGLEIVGASLHGGTVDGANDHRIVMSAAVASLACHGDVTILGIGAEAKSYPAFFELIQSTH
ncbi:MAG: 3-phosphoshikimate 1-carboxyvinyltransferase [Clostridia bacterium]|nr:3-phosphoshikimate 1-carboxyvinyltransferase [Clostridia bacterium]